MYNPNLHFHFTGIGGSGMSGIAEILLSLGFRVSGSDLKFTDLCKRLESFGAKVGVGHRAENLPQQTTMLVHSAAVRPDNPEILEAKRRGIPCVTRAEVLAELMRLKFGVAVAGSHGKTTTTSLIASILEVGGLDPTVIIGGKVKSLGTGGKLGKSDFLVAESDESDRSFLLLKPTIAVVTNIDNEHLGAYESLGELESSFEQFVRSVPFYGLAVLCSDDERVREIRKRVSSEGRVRQITYGVSLDSDIRADEIEYSPGASSFTVLRRGENIGRIHLPMPGRHLVVNSLAAISVGLEFGIPFSTIQSALGAFEGVARRLEIVGNERGVTVMNDYAHHPAEIRATLGAIRSGWGEKVRRVHAVFQPHRFSRTRDCFIQFLDCFSDADELVMTDIYSAGEDPIEGISGEKLFDAVQHHAKYFVPHVEDVVSYILPRLENGDLVVCLGAGSVGTLPERIVEEISRAE